MSKIGRNDPCPCGSGKKYKKCCENTDKTNPIQQNTPQKPRYATFSMSIVFNPRPRSQKRKTPSRTNRKNRFQPEQFPGDKIAQNFMEAFTNIILSAKDASDAVLAAHLPSAIKNTLTQLDLNHTNIPDPDFQKILEPYALLRFETDTTPGLEIFTKHLQEGLQNHHPAQELYQQLSQQRFALWTFTPPPPPNYLTSALINSNFEQIPHEIDAFFALSDKLDSIIHLAMPITFDGYKFMLSFGALFPHTEAINTLLRLNALIADAPTKNPEHAKILEQTALRYLLDPHTLTDTSSFPDYYYDYDDDDDDYYPHYHEVLDNILFYLNEDLAPKLYEECIPPTFFKMIHLTTPKELKNFNKQLKKAYEKAHEFEYCDTFEELEFFEEGRPISRIHELLRNDYKQATAFLKSASKKPAALLLDDDLLKQLNINRLDTVETVENTIKNLEDPDLAARAQHALNEYLKNQRMSWLLGLQPDGSIAAKNPENFWLYYTYLLIKDFAPTQFQKLPISALPTTNAVLTRLQKALGKNISISQLPSSLQEVHELPGIGQTTLDALNDALTQLFLSWPWIAAKLDPQNLPAPQKTKLSPKEAKEAQKALDDLNKLF